MADVTQQLLARVDQAELRQVLQPTHTPLYSTPGGLSPLATPTAGELLFNTSYKQKDIPSPVQFNDKLIELLTKTIEEQAEKINRLTVNVRELLEEKSARENLNRELLQLNEESLIDLSNPSAVTTNIENAPIQTRASVQNDSRDTQLNTQPQENRPVLNQTPSLNTVQAKNIIIGTGILSLIPQFTADPEDIFECDRWIKSLINLATNLSWSPEIIRLVMEAKLSAKAGIMYNRGLANFEGISMQERIRQFKILFSKAPKRDEGLKLVNTCVQLQGESFGAYQQRLVATSNALNSNWTPEMKEELLLAQVKRGILNPALRLDVLKSNPATFNQAVKTALDIEESYMAIDNKISSIPEVKLENSRNEGFSKYNNSRNYKQRKQKSYFNKAIKTEPKIQATSLKARNNEAEHSTDKEDSDSPSQVTVLQGKPALIRCYCCHETGHISRNCPKQTKASSSIVKEGCDLKTEQTTDTKIQTKASHESRASSPSTMSNSDKNDSQNTVPTIKQNKKEGHMVAIISSRNRKSKKIGKQLNQNNDADNPTVLKTPATKINAESDLEITDHDSTHILPQIKARSQVNNPKNKNIKLVIVNFSDETPLRPIIKVKLYGKVFSALIDTGSEYTVINEDCAPVQSNASTLGFVTITSPLADEAIITRKSIAEFCVNETNFFHPVLLATLASGAQFPVILGMDFIIKHNAKIDILNKRVTFEVEAVTRSEELANYTASICAFDAQPRAPNLHKLFKVDEMELKPFRKAMLKKLLTNYETILIKEINKIISGEQVPHMEPRLLSNSETYHKKRRLSYDDVSDKEKQTPIKQMTRTVIKIAPQANVTKSCPYHVKKKANCKQCHDLNVFIDTALEDVPIPNVPLHTVGYHRPNRFSLRPTKAKPKSF